MKGLGFSLVEVLVAMAIFGLLMAISTLNFKEYLLRHRAEAQIRMIYGQILKARSDAICQRREVRVKIYPARFLVYSSGNDTPGVAPVQTLPLAFPVSCKGTAASDGGYPIEFDSRGITFDSCTICLPPEASHSSVDSVVVFKTRVRVGKKETPEVCDAEKISDR